VRIVGRRHRRRGDARHDVRIVAGGRVEHCDTVVVAGELEPRT
jgi:hypothetical protein